MRLAKYIAQRGYCSRRRAEELISLGQVQVNGVTASINLPVNPETDVVIVCGESLELQAPVYILLNKPPGVVCSCKRGREKFPIVLDIVKVSQRIFPVGRLDSDSRGLLLLTNDGELAYSLTHPSQESEKEYIVKLNMPLTPDDEQLLTAGISLYNATCCFYRMEKLSEREYRVELKQGLKRQIRLMVRSVSKEVVDLQRVRVGNLKLGDLPEGKWRHLTEIEINSLKERSKK